jgi:hypothetical protein
MKKLLFLFLILLIPACSPESSYTIEDNTAIVNLQGYTGTCIYGPYIYENHSDGVSNYIPSHEYILNGEYYINLCDVVICEKITEPLNIPLLGYELILDGEIPEYQTKELEGEIVIEITYFSDKDCNNEKEYIITLN